VFVLSEEEEGLPDPTSVDADPAMHLLDAPSRILATTMGINVTSSPGIHGQTHSAEKWSHLHSKPLELSSSLRSKRLTEGYYASLALVFKLAGRT
jgi:hypothetical protein